MSRGCPLNHTEILESHNHTIDKVFSQETHNVDGEGSSVGLITAGLVLSSVAVVNADSTTPPPTAKSPTSYALQLAAYQDALIQYRVTVVVNNINYRIALEKYQADWQATLAKYEDPYKAALAQYLPLQSAYAAKMAPVATARRSAFDKADSDFLAALAIATTSAQKNAALQAHAAAISAAGAAYKAAIAAIGVAPVKPVKPAELTKPALPVKPVDPTKPVAPIKPEKSKN